MRCNVQVTMSRIAEGRVIDGRICGRRFSRHVQPIIEHGAQVGLEVRCTNGHETPIYFGD